MRVKHQRLTVNLSSLKDWLIGLDTRRTFPSSGQAATISFLSCKHLTCQVGRTGVVTPVAEFEPVPLAGTTVSRATLHNADRLAELGLCAGDTIVVRKAGEIIPEVVRVLVELRPEGARRLELPHTCPECGSVLVQEEGEAATRCVNNDGGGRGGRQQAQQGPGPGGERAG